MFSACCLLFASFIALNFYEIVRLWQIFVGNSLKSLRCAKKMYLMAERVEGEFTDGPQRVCGIVETSEWTKNGDVIRKTHTMTLSKCS